jgi:hypothetical protein
LEILVPHARRLLALVLAAVLLEATSVAAQQPGARVRIAADTLGPSPAVGNLVSLTRDSIAFVPVPSGYPVGGSRTADTVSLARTAVRHFEVHRGTHRNAGKGLRLGALSGGAIGGIAGAVSYSPCVRTEPLACLFTPNNAREAAELGGAAGALLGLVVGALIGAFVVTDSWVPADFASVSHVSIVPHAKGVGAQLSVSFR